MTANIVGILVIDHETGTIKFRQTNSSARSEEMLTITGLGKIPVNVDTITIREGVSPLEGVREPFVGTVEIATASQQEGSEADQQ